MKTIEEKIAVMQAFADGKKIEYIGNGRAPYGFVTDVAPSWNWGMYDYRVKPEPKYRPYKDADECIKDVIKHGGWVKSKKVETTYLIIEVGEAHVDIKERCFALSVLLRDFVWADDESPCGIKEE